MITLKEITEAYWPGKTYGRGNSAAISRLLRHHQNIKTVKIDGIIYVDAKLPLPQLVADLKSAVDKNRSANRIEYMKQWRALHNSKPVSPPTDLVEKLARTVEKQAEIIADLRAEVDSLRARLGQQNSTKLSETVQRAIATYGD